MPKTIIDLRMEYKRDTGELNVPLSSERFCDTDYVQWLEERLLASVEAVQHLANELITLKSK